MNYSMILKQAKEGTIDQQTIITIAIELASKQYIANPYTLLHILGRAEAKQYEDLISSYLEYKDDPMLVALSLRILCLYWNLADKYIDVLNKHISGLDWDTDNHVQLMSISIAGEYIHHGGKNQEVLRAILSQYRVSHEKIVRETSYSALCRAIGLDHLSVIEEEKRYKNTKHKNSQIIDKVNLMLNNKC